MRLLIPAGKRSAQHAWQFLWLICPYATTGTGPCLWSPAPLPLYLPLLVPRRSTRTSLRVHFLFPSYILVQYFSFVSSVLFEQLGIHRVRSSFASPTNSIFHSTRPGSFRYANRHRYMYKSMRRCRQAHTQSRCAAPVPCTCIFLFLSFLMLFPFSELLCLCLYLYL